MAWEDTNKTPGATETRSGIPAANPQAGGTDEWLKLAQDAYTQSTTYFDNNVRKQVEDGLRLFNSQHTRDSKYSSDAYKYRSRLVRPRLRSIIRKHEAAAWMALFSSPDYANVDPVDQDNMDQVASAGINKQLLQYRLSKSLPWTIISIGALQDAAKVGICASFNYWEYVATTTKETVQADFFGQSLEMEVPKTVVKVDKPCVELLPVENIRFHPAAKWYDVVGTSPYLIVELPMYLRDVLEKMEAGGGKGAPEWKRLSKDILLTARISDTNPVQQARESRREDPQAQTSPVNEFDMVMVHLNFIKVEDECYCYYTLKDKALLSDPRPLAEVFLHGEIPITLGFCVIETHKTMPSGLTHLGKDLHQEGTEIVNQRLDNVKYVLNKRRFVRRGSNVDVEGMLRNVPGGITMVNDVEKDVRTDEMNDVTASSYQEQDRVNADMDALLGGGLNSDSVMTNRKLGETVGGMRMLAQGGNAITELDIHIWLETWYVPTLRQLIKLEQYYESDEVILALASKKAGMYQRFQQSPDLDELLKAELTVTVNAGMGATDPQQRFQSFMQATGAYAQIVQASQMIGDLNLPEVRKELFGLAGWRDSARFFGNVDPRWQQAQQMMQQAQGLAREVVDKAKDRLLRREMQLERREVDLGMKELSLEQEDGQQEFALMAQKANLEARIDQRKAAQEAQQKAQEHAAEMQMRKQEHMLEMVLKRLEARQDIQLKAFEARQNAQNQRMLAQAKAAATEAQGRKVKRSAKKQADGSWEISET